MDENAIIHKILEVFEYKNEYQFRSSNIQPQDMYVLERIFFNGKMAAKDLSKKYDIPPSTLTGIIDRLESRRLIERLRTSADRRSIELAVTAEGEAAVLKHLEEDRLFSRNLFNTLEPSKSENLKELLGELLTNVKKECLFFSDTEHRGDPNGDD